jgi:23S rRNA U2552 (ribose-2'-O)-methylase RlmE/FtsJ
MPVWETTSSVADVRSGPDFAKVGANVESGLPPVVSVRKSKKGCAVVILRDPAIIERCVLQRAAVVDGVCVEMTRHRKKSRADEEEGIDQPAGIFVAWGAKVEQKVPVSEQGIEEFFNSLAGKMCPEGLVAAPPFQEGHVSYPLSSDGTAALGDKAVPIVANHEEILSSIFCQRDLVRALGAAKDRLDALWERPPPPMARSLMMRVARAQLFPSSGEGGRDHENRAGDKLAELSELTKLLDGITPGSAFLDLCGGPGAWSQHLLEKRDLHLRGYGFTLKAGAGAAEDWKAQAKDEWYADLYQHPNWTALWGADGTGDLLKLGNLEHCVEQLRKENVLLCVADGGFSDAAIPQNLQELYFYRLFLAELLLAASCLSRGGKFICKLYTSFSTSTAALLYLATKLFDKVEVVKPMTSKATGPERYLVAAGFRDNEETSVIKAALARSHRAGNGASPLVMPLLTPLVTRDCLAQDTSFLSAMGTMVEKLCERQTQALNAVVDRADFLENMAMQCAVCTNPWIKRSPRQSESNKENDSRQNLNIPTQSGNSFRRYPTSGRWQDFPPSTRSGPKGKRGYQ